jgi:hypothetical protein
MILTTLAAIVVIGFQGTGTAQSVKTPPARQETARIAVSSVSAKALFEQLKKGILGGVSVISYEVENNVIFVRGTADGIKALRALIQRIESPREVRILRRFVLRTTSAATVRQQLIEKLIPGIDFLSYDPVENSIVARGTTKAMEELAAKIQALDKIDT